MAPYPIFFRALKTIIMPNFMLLTESEQFKHIWSRVTKKTNMAAFWVLKGKTADVSSVSTQLY